MKPFVTEIDGNFSNSPFSNASIYAFFYFLSFTTSSIERFNFSLVLFNKSCNFLIISKF
ncbi:hypothetical protein M1145_02220 [Patescibacteria group bacterium]|nr:hypothetical protein [Patescibacteria group bacterium]